MKYSTASVLGFTGYAVAAVQPAPAYPATTTAVCLPGGEYSADGRYSCSPAHEYPDGKKCVKDGDCYYLVDGPKPTGCVAPGQINDLQQYGCDPKSDIPSQGKVCSVNAKDGCYYLVDAPTSSSSAPVASATCVAPGQLNDLQQYGCDPKGPVYTPGKVCSVYKDGCYYLVDAPTGTSSASAFPSYTCPPGGTGPDGRYSCNPAHQYPVGQECVLQDGCYYLITTTGSAVMPSTSAPSAPAPTGVVPTGSASSSAPTAPAPYGPTLVPSVSGKTNGTATSVVAYTGAAGQLLANGASLAAVALGALFL